MPKRITVILAPLLAAVLLAATTRQTQASQIFDFSFTNVSGSVSGTVTGEIVLPFNGNGTGNASQVLIESFPAGLVDILGPAPINARQWAQQQENQFTVSGGQVVGADFWASIGTDQAQLYIDGDPVHGGFNYLNIDGTNTSTVFGANGLAAANITPAAPAPEPSSVVLLVTGAAGLLWAARRRRQSTSRRHS